MGHGFREAKEVGKMNRRMFIKTMGALGGSALTARSAAAVESSSSIESIGVLVDESRCVGCHRCEVVCAEAHGLPKPDLDAEAALRKQRPTTEAQLTVVNGFETATGRIFAKRQCMHCNQPACASACLTGAMHKTKKGPVLWDPNRCMGCRYCMIACPFDMPKFEYHKAIPNIRKCDLCCDRLQEGKQPACVEACPAKVMLFGKRSDLIETARTRIYQRPDKYFHHIYGEHEAGGTGWIYISPAPMDQLGFKTNLGTVAYPEYTKQFLYSVPVVLILWPTMLLALNRATRPGGME